MPTFAITGQATFSTKNKRDSALTVISNKASQRGLTASAQDGFPAGAVSVGTTALTLSFTTTNEAELPDTDGTIFGHFHANALEGAYLNTWVVSE